MAEKPILFSGEMVRAILEEKKTQTRRVVVPPGWVKNECVTDSGNPHWMLDKRGERFYLTEWSRDKAHSHLVTCPYGRPGDLLWVRETWSTAATFDQMKPSDIPPGQNIWYAVSDYSDFVVSAGHWKGKRRPSIFMPRWASRITLRINDVRVERVQDISEADAKAEGVTKDRPGGWISCESYQMLFRRLWDDINTKRGYGWNVNPWVWVVEFEVVR